MVQNILKSGECIFNNFETLRYAENYWLASNN